MLKMRKFLSIALVVVMLLSTVAVSSFALADGKQVGLILKTDKTVAEIVPGAKVTVYFHFEMADYNQKMSDTKVALLFDSNIYTPDLTSRTFLGDWAEYAKDATTAKLNAAYGTTVMSQSTMTAEEQAKYNSAVMLTAGADAGLGATNKAGYNVTEGENGISVAECSIVFDVTGDAEAIKNGNINISIADTCNTTQFIKMTDGSSTPKNPANGIDASRANILANMPVASSIVKFSKAQIRFQGIGADKDKTNYKNAFDVRTVAKISQADFIATFTDEANAKAKITDFGFVYAAKSNVADFSVDTAKAVAEGGSAENYVKKSVTYMQHTGDGADYVFTCLITDIADTDANKADGVNCLAFVCFDGTYYYFDAAASVSYGDLYTTHFPA